ncbi:hypothetical protein LA080_002534 [Diaporthe eres]|nr:hypothetical protein LA080_002534 [Diaporthe eres]
MDTSSLYSYSLDEARREIRLLTLLPCEDEEGQIVCQLETASLADDPEYGAMSYVWGDSAITKEILINNIAFPATTNLVSGLLHLRRHGLGLPGKEDDTSLPRLWVDAKCINQQDTAERNHQVALMGEIYMGALYVLSWLGLPGEGIIDNPLRLIRSFSQALPGRFKQAITYILNNAVEGNETAKISDDTKSYLRSYLDDNAGDQRQPKIGNLGGILTKLVREGCKWVSEHPEFHISDRNDPTVTAWKWLWRLAELPYWTRLWIQQERILCRALSANVIRFGAAAITFEELNLFGLFLSVIEANRMKPPEMNQDHWYITMQAFRGPIWAGMLNIRDVWKRGVPSPGTLLSLAQSCKATDPRDMVYGLRSLLNLNLDVDYDKTVREVYLDWHAEALEHCRVQGKPETCGISQAGRGISSENPRGIPSWMPDLAILHKRGFVHQEHGGAAKLGIGGRFQLTGAEGQQYSEDGVLSVYGVECNRVSRTSLAMVDQDHPIEGLKELAIDYVLEMKTRNHPTGLRPLQVLFYTTHQGNDPETRKPFPSRLDPTSVLARNFFLTVADGQTMDPKHDWSHVDVEAAGGMRAYLASRFRDTADADENERWSQAVPEGVRSKDERVRSFQWFKQSCRRILEDKAIFYTTDGYIGIGPRYLQVGDQLCVINNCHLPVLLRAEGSGHVLVGAVYLYGLSGNESLDMLKSGKVTLRKFEIH